MSQIWMPLYVGDYLADTSHLTTVEHGAYMLMIMHYWRVGSLPKDERQLQRITRMSNRQWFLYRDNLLSFFDADMKHQRIENELSKAQRSRHSKSVSGALGGKAKALKYKEAVVANATNSPKRKSADALAITQSHTQSYTEGTTPVQEVKHSNSSTGSTTLSVIRGANDDAFDAFWREYPRKVGKGAAVKAWAVALKKASAETILDGLRRHDWNPDPRYLPHPATWLNQQRWEDEPTPRRLTLSEQLALEAMAAGPTDITPKNGF